MDASDDVNIRMLIAAAVFAILRAVMIDRIGGTTGDTAGAMLEWIETSALVAAALMMDRRTPPPLRAGASDQFTTIASP